MNFDVFDDIVLLQETQNMDELCRTYERLMCKYGFDLFAVQFTPNDYKAAQKKPFAIATYDPKWVDYYFEQDYHLIDPVINIGVSSKTPFLWSDGWKGIDLNKKQKKFFSEAHDFGVGIGVGIPILSPYHTNGMVSLVSSIVKAEEAEKIVRQHALELQLLANNFQQKVEFFSSQISDRPEIANLTEREKECLKWVAIGKSDRDIADLLGISHRTVNQHMTNALLKLNASNRSAAIIKAFINKMITL